MVQNITGSFQLMKSLNRSLVLNIIRKEEAISRTDIAKKANLTPPTVSTIVSELLETGIIREFKIGESKGGRKPILLSINYNNYFVIGVDVGTEEVRAGLTNLNAEILATKKQKLATGMTKNEFVTILEHLIRSLLENEKVDKTKVIGIGIGMHGIVDHEKGISIYAPHFGFENIPLKDKIENVFDIPVTVENDARSLALAELWFGNGRDAQNLVCINVGDGIGAGIILNGQLFHGKHNIAGEFGHMIVDLNGRQCTCGSYGCLHTVASGIRIKERVTQEITIGRRTIIPDLVDGKKEEITGATVHEAAKRGDAFAVEVLDEAGRFLGIGITNLINFMNPDKIIVGGGVSKAGDFIMAPLKETVKKRAMTTDAKSTEITVSELAAQGTMIGAVTLVLKQLYDRS
ncbi:ROK family transcriptional regulator [Salipaludibacillus aurantiacus]|uniref:ROK family protein (Putative glucokinase) n=1 Tax=Salipaludibacillus aurantiacus TaxID=1601833 RepID=A0A1H9W9A3_9BACI|nr:ROK family transcriptional regulator [Salipaludibacillus aurantiacus]SES30502.1 ROK family protein (putative glucokinase) [Salipaludibacillus aurantiacus]